MRPMRGTPILVAENHRREVHPLAPRPIAVAVGAICGSYYPVLGIGRIYNEKRLLAEHALYLSGR
jgi:hypothetical protein